MGLEQFSPEEAQLFRIPNSAEVTTLTEERSARLRQQFDAEFRQDMKKLEEFDNPKQRKAYEGSTILKYGLKLSTTYQVPANFDQMSFMRRYFAGETELKLAESGFAGERGVARIAHNMGAEVYLASDDLDVNYAVDLVLDVSEVGNSDFATSETIDLDEEDQVYNYLAVSIKALVDVPPADDFNLLLPCRSLAEVRAELESRREIFYKYYGEDQGEREHRIDGRWEALTAKCMQAAESMHGYDRNGRRKHQSIAEEYDNVFPVLFLMPSIHSSNRQYTPDGLPDEVLDQRGVEAFMSELPRIET